MALEAVNIVSAFKGSIALTATGTTILFTVPSGKKLIVLGATVRITALDNFGEPSPAITIGNNIGGGTYDNLVASVTLDGSVGDVKPLTLATPTPEIDSEVRVEVTTGSGSVTHTAEIHVWGFIR